MITGKNNVKQFEVPAGQAETARDLLIEYVTLNKLDVNVFIQVPENPKADTEYIVTISGQSVGVLSRIALTNFISNDLPNLVASRINTKLVLLEGGVNAYIN